MADPRSSASAWSRADARPGGDPGPGASPSPDDNSEGGDDPGSGPDAPVDGDPGPKPAGPATSRCVLGSRSGPDESEENPGSDPGPEPSACCSEDPRSSPCSSGAANSGTDPTAGADSEVDPADHDSPDASGVVVVTGGAASSAGGDGRVSGDTPMCQRTVDPGLSAPQMGSGRLPAGSACAFGSCGHFWVWSTADVSPSWPEVTGALCVPASASARPTPSLVISAGVLL